MATKHKIESENGSDSGVSNEHKEILREDQERKKVRKSVLNIFDNFSKFIFKLDLGSRIPWKDGYDIIAAARYTLTQT